jgi:hypothetical protein
MVTAKKNKKPIISRIIDSYSAFLYKRSWLVIFLVIILLMLSGIYASQIQNKSMDYRSVLPENVEVISANFEFEDEFGGTDTAKFVIEVDPEYSKSNELRDIRDPDVLVYAKHLQEYIETSDQVTSVSSAVELFESLNGGFLPKNKNDIITQIQENPLLSNYISDDATMMIVNVRLIESYDEDEVVYDMEHVVESVAKPDGIITNIGGDSISGVYINEQMSSDMSKTSQISILGIIIILLLISGSIKYGLLPLSTIIVGLMWTMGFIGASGMSMSSATSGVMSMIMGIGIDFGIQIITRFRQELRTNNIQKSMSITLNNVIYPMFTTTLAAVIGFQSMSLGQLTIMAEMGTMMTLGVIFCFFAALTIVPALTIFVEKFSENITSTINNQIKKINKTIRGK